MKAWFRNAQVRLGARAVVAGAAVVLAQWLGGGAITKATLVAAVLVAAEIFTPLNGIVGYFKQPPK